jgi:hypothetical protein
MNTSRTSGHVIDAFELSYENGSSLDRSGRILSKDAKRALREVHGYCLTCPAVPVKLFDIRKSRMNPLWSSKTPKSDNGKSVNGVCVLCSPDHNHNRHLYVQKARQNSLARTAVSESSSTSLSVSNHSSIGSFQAAEYSRESPHNRAARNRSVDNSASLIQPTARSSARLGPGGVPTGSGVPSGSPPDSQHRRAPRRMSTGSSTPSFSMASTSTRQQSLPAASDGMVGGNPEDSQQSRARHRRPYSRAQHSRPSGGGNGQSCSDTQDGMADRSERSVVSVERSVVSVESDDRSLQSLSLAEQRRRLGSQRSTGSSESDCRSRASAAREDRSLRRGSEVSVQSTESDLGSFSMDQCENVRSGRLAGRRKNDYNVAGRSHDDSSDDRSLSAQSGPHDDQGRQFRADSFTSSSHSCARQMETRGVAPTAARMEVAQQEQTNQGLVSNLEALFEDMEAMGNAELLFEVIINSMDSHPKVEDIQLVCIRKVVRVFSDTRTDATSFLLSKGHKRLLFAMKTFPASLRIQEECCEALAVLSVRQDATRVILIRSETCTFINKALMRFLGDEALAESAIKTLRSLSFEREGSSALGALAIQEKIVEVMYCNLTSEAIQRDGCALLSNLSVDLEKQRVSAVGKGVIAVIIAAMKEHNENSSVIASACFALKNFTHEESNLRTLVKVDKALEVVYRAAAIESATDDASVVIERMQMSMARDESVEDQAHESLKALVELRCHQPEVVVDIINTLQNYQWSERMATECVKMLISLASTSEAHKNLLSEESNLQHLQVCADTHHFDGVTRNETLRLIGLVNGNT